METLKYNLVNNWNVIRLIRLALSIIIIVQAVQIHDVLFGLFGTFFLYQALSNTGCCGVNGCAPSVSKSSGDTEEIEFTEVKK
ncbi:MAG: hypothetical protein IPP60_02985 [Sphingobacteriales bacterium]|nr:hypothetical protein [Sphingobacteriales bacterium]MBP8192274.1 hypothetical protein [Chitinophagales bacterium]MCC6582723.1 hypothetical protein [Chitinophagales bacterium]